MTGEGLDALTEAIEARIAADRVTLSLVLDSADGAGVSWLHRHAEVISKSSGEDGRVAMKVRVAPEREIEVRRRFPGLDQGESAAADPGRAA